MTLDARKQFHTKCGCINYAFQAPGVEVNSFFIIISVSQLLFEGRLPISPYVEVDRSDVYAVPIDLDNP